MIGYDEINPSTGLTQREMDADIEAALDWLDRVQDLPNEEKLPSSNG